MCRYASFRFEELPLRGTLCDGEAEVRYFRNSDEIVYAEVTRSFNEDTGAVEARFFPQAEIAAALEKHQRQHILDVIADAKAWA